MRSIQSENFRKYEIILFSLNDIYVHFSQPSCCNSLVLVEVLVNYFDTGLISGPMNTIDHHTRKLIIGKITIKLKLPRNIMGVKFGSLYYYFIHRKFFVTFSNTSVG